MQALGTGSGTVYLGIIEEKYLLGAATYALDHTPEYLGCGFLDTHFVRKEDVLEEVTDTQSLVAEENLLGLRPMYGVGIAEQVQVIMTFGAEQRFETFRGHTDQVSFPGTDNVGIGQAGLSTDFAQFIAKFVYTDFAALQLRQYTHLSIRPDERPDVKSQASEGPDAAFLVQIDEDATKIE